MSPLHFPSLLSGRIRTLPSPAPESGQHDGVSVGGPKPRLFDLAVVIGIMGLIVTLLMPTLGSRRLTLPTATRGLVENLRLTQARATSRGVHFRVTVKTDSYEIQQLQDNDGDGLWGPDAAFPAWRVPLPPTVSISQRTGLVIEFDARGFVIGLSGSDSAAVITIQLTDSQDGRSAEIQIFPSGQVQEA